MRSWDKCCETKESPGRGERLQRGYLSFSGPESPLGRIKSCVSTWGKEFQVKHAASAKAWGVDKNGKPEEQREAHGACSHWEKRTIHERKAGVPKLWVWLVKGCHRHHQWLYTCILSLKGSDTIPGEAYSGTCTNPWEASLLFYLWTLCVPKAHSRHPINMVHRALNFARGKSSQLSEALSVLDTIFPCSVFLTFYIWLSYIIFKQHISV